VTDALLHPFAPPSKPEADYIRLVRASGSTLYDDRGRSFIDGMAGLWYCQVGHGRPEMIDAITSQLDALDAYHLFDPFTNGPAVDAAEAIRSRSPHPDGRVFFTCGGSEAVDTALKLARLVGRMRGDSERQIIVRRTTGYHGTNFGGTSAQGIAANREGWGDLVPHFVEVPQHDIEAAGRVFAEHGERIAAVITEPVQGAGGVHPPVEGYLPELRRLCSEHGSLLIFDEVITGFGRTGNWFAADTFGVTPDLMTFAKGVTSGYLPFGGVILSSEVAAVLDEPEFFLRTGYTYSGHPVAAAAAVRNIELIEEEGLCERAEHIGERLGGALAALDADGSVESHRGIAGVWAVELGRDAIPVRDAVLEHGVVIRPLGQALVFCPPLVVTDDELDQITDALDAALR
jgi:adenosylmethionine-8-amino-7-oxononanoate aminotransferase